MKILHTLFAFGYVANKTFDPLSFEPEWVSCMTMSLVVGSNIVSICALEAIVSGDNSILSFWGSYYSLLFFPAILCLEYLYFIKGDRYKDVMKELDGFNDRKRKLVMRLGVAYEILSIVSLTVLMAIVGGVRF